MTTGDVHRQQPEVEYHSFKKSQLHRPSSSYEAANSFITVTTIVVISNLNMRKMRRINCFVTELLESHVTGIKSFAMIIHDQVTFHCIFFFYINFVETVY